MFGKKNGVFWVDSNFIRQFSVFLLGLAGLVAEVENLKGQKILGLEGHKGG